jgi:hypothetical protein
MMSHVRNIISGLGTWSSASNDHGCGTEQMLVRTWGDTSGKIEGPARTGHWETTSLKRWKNQLKMESGRQLWRAYRCHGKLEPWRHTQLGWLVQELPGLASAGKLTRVFIWAYNIETGSISNVRLPKQLQTYHITSKGENT